MKIKNKNCRIRLMEMKRLLQESQIPITLTDTSLFEDEESLPHWVVITGYSGADWFVNNHLEGTANTRIKQDRLNRNLADRGIQCAVVMCGARNTDLG